MPRGKRSRPLTDIDVQQIRNNVAAGVKQVRVAEECGISISYVSRLISGKRFKKGGKLKLTVDDILDIRTKYSTGKFTMAELGRVYNRHLSTIQKIISHKLHAYVLPDDEPEEAEDACEPAPVQRRQPLSGIDELKW